ncbi:conserved hypothetical protein [Desulfohalobium retbaense DSM 5692]|uniref:Uncharacterized protein n=1 Tax=Desulfohalobium retbaense (strain ATCC 49708 / DSM 5692 / JCM 16813 / HR100) TaxID=485915 RepID=C8X1R2_DESRD|nr:conserved hypothetical protein [Desulfohalobium retbaense DSM 5692]
MEQCVPISKRTICIADIFGTTPAFERLCQAIGGAVEVVDPYSGLQRKFASEQEAYAYFMTEVGLDRYSEMVRDQIAAAQDSACLVGFSVGAAVAWSLTGASLADQVSCGVCFYGSQIRHMLDIQPVVPVTCILPTSEPAFCVQTLAKALSGRNNVSVETTPYLHGFMNEVSANYDRQGCAVYLEWLQRM